MFEIAYSNHHWPDPLHSVGENALALLVELRLSSVRNDEEDWDDDDDDADAGAHSAAYYHSDIHVTVAVLVWIRTRR